MWKTAENHRCRVAQSWPVVENEPNEEVGCTIWHPTCAKCSTLQPFWFWQIDNQPKLLFCKYWMQMVVFHTLYGHAGVCRREKGMVNHSLKIDLQESCQRRFHVDLHVCCARCEVCVDTPFEVWLKPMQTSRVSSSCSLVFALSLSLSFSSHRHFENKERAVEVEVTDGCAAALWYHMATMYKLALQHCGSV